VQVKKKVKEKKGRLPRPRIDIRREAIPSGFGLIVHGIHEGEKRLHLGNLRRGESSDFFSSRAGEQVDQVHERENETFFGAVNFFLRFFFRFFFLFFLDTISPGQARFDIALYKTLYKQQGDYIVPILNLPEFFLRINLRILFCLADHLAHPLLDFVVVLIRNCRGNHGELHLNSQFRRKGNVLECIFGNHVEKK